MCKFIDVEMKLLGLATRVIFCFVVLSVSSFVRDCCFVGFGYGILLTFYHSSLHNL